MRIALWDTTSERAILSDEMFTIDPSIDRCPANLRSLRNLLAGYFHQDMDLEYGNAEYALKQAIENATEEVMRSAISQIEWLIAQNFTEVDLRCILREQLYFEWLPEPPLSNWIRFVASELVKSLPGTGSARGD